MYTYTLSKKIGKQHFESYKRRQQTMSFWWRN